MSTEHGDNELELGPDDILVDGLIKKSIKNQGELEVAIGDGMEFTIHGDLKSKNKKAKTVLSSMRVCQQHIGLKAFSFVWKRVATPFRADSFLVAHLVDAERPIR